MGNEVGFIGLGKMGYGMARRLVQKGLDIIAYDADPVVMRNIPSYNIHCVSSLKDVALGLRHPRRIFLMIPANAVDLVINNLVPLLEHKDVVIDGGNSWYVDSMRRYEMLKRRDISFLDAGVSGGLEASIKGACVMVGGDQDVYSKCKDIFEALACEDGCKRVGSYGAGHFVKGVHNAIEYAIFEALGEGLMVLDTNSQRFGLELDKVVDLLQNGSIIRSLALSFAQEALSEDVSLKKYDVPVGGVTTDEMKKIVEEAKEIGLDLPAIEASINVREESVKNRDFRTRIVQAIRNVMGGHLDIRE